MTTWITICETCKREGWEESGATETDGARLAEAIEARPVPEGVRLRRHACLMGCGKGCNVAIQAAGKLCYTLGGFEPGAEAAQALLDYAALHAQSDSGQVPYRQWPQGVKGHFVTRHPPLPDT
ncbi:DUF1636 domain-containing protein [Psychromarinibacter sp. C21-152]|uniref:DUF1636 domain-containing protein n=1 Tax=Psychromarinibacter sediminicola TaxID=3033385 RepID=A0AAE3NRS2_9RHOB|nr:DUF1636 domain-containing protein [Psychromarinibacter sediminicola]MDF0600866.1 DUF1636 domain-containing protein [Psychromarinibacter sediminicola]